MADEAENQAGETLPAAEDLAFLHPLYSQIETSNFTFLLKLKRGMSFRFDMYCVGCGREATFAVASKYAGTLSHEVARQEGEFTTEAACTRAGHRYVAYMNYHDGKVTKVGQFPSVADIQGAEIRRYKSLLRDGYFAELSRAIGLASHGVGIGSFVYLRRIFEKLIWDHHADRAAASGEIDGFATKRMDEKIKALGDALPEALVENAAAYSILSKGIHELTEEECKLYFPIVKAAIINILEDDYQARERAAASRKVAEEVAALQRKLKTKG
jgi:hypothetical protein